MDKTKKERREVKRRRLKNKKLCKKYWWLRPDYNIMTGRRIKDYNYDWTWFDDFPDGWGRAFGMMMVEEIHQELLKIGAQRWKNDPWRRFAIHQIKEKFGMLRCYPSWTTPEIDRIISKYECISEHVCINCGQPDTYMTNEGWIMPQCYKCYKKNYRAREKWMLEHHPDRQAASEIEIQKAYMKSVGSDDDGMIPESYSYTRYEPGGEKQEFTVDISDTVRKVRMKYEREQRRRSHKRLSKMGE